MGKFKDLTGQKFGRLTALESVGKDKFGQYLWRCECECGKNCIVRGGSLTSGNTKSCGCSHKEALTARNTKHRLTDAPLYKKWLDIKTRCFNPKRKDHKDYGGRGITMYPAWINDFKAFYDYVSQLEHFNEEGYTLDREDNDGNYEPGNLRYATKTEQARNQRSNIIVEYDGREMTLAEASERSGIKFGTLWDRYKRGDRGEKLFRPVKGR